MSKVARGSLSLDTRSDADVQMKVSGIPGSRDQFNFYISTPPSSFLLPRI